MSTDIRPLSSDEIECLKTMSTNTGSNTTQEYIINASLNPVSMIVKLVDTDSEQQTLTFDGALFVTSGRVCYVGQQRTLQIPGETISMNAKLSQTDSHCTLMLRVEDDIIDSVLFTCALSDVDGLYKGIMNCIDISETTQNQKMFDSQIDVYTLSPQICDDNDLTYMTSDDSGLVCIGSINPQSKTNVANSLANPYQVDTQSDHVAFQQGVYVPTEGYEVYRSNEWLVNDEQLEDHQREELESWDAKFIIPDEFKSFVNK